MRAARLLLVTGLAAGARVLYTTTIENTSTRTLDDVQLQMRVPWWLPYDFRADADPDSSNYVACLEGADAVRTLGFLEPDESATVIVNAMVLDELLAGSLITVGQRVAVAGVPAVVEVQRTVATEN